MRKIISTLVVVAAILTVGSRAFAAIQATVYLIVTPSSSTSGTWAVYVVDDGYTGNSQGATVNDGIADFTTTVNIGAGGAINDNTNTGVAGSFLTAPVGSNGTTTIGFTGPTGTINSGGTSETFSTAQATGYEAGNMVMGVGLPGTTTTYFTTGSNNGNDNGNFSGYESQGGTIVSEITNPPSTTNLAGNTNTQFTGTEFWNGSGSVTSFSGVEMFTGTYSGAAGTTMTLSSTGMYAFKTAASAASSTTDLTSATYLATYTTSASFTDIGIIASPEPMSLGLLGLGGLALLFRRPSRA